MATNIPTDRQQFSYSGVARPLCSYPAISVQPLNYKPEKYSFDEYSFSDEDETDKPDYTEAIVKGRIEVGPSIYDSRDEETPDYWFQRNPTMIRLTGKHPFNSEPSLTLLMHHGFITPVPLHYVRNHGHVPKVCWNEWTVEITGLVKQPTRFTMDQLVSEFASIEFPATLVCAGNRRKEQNMVKKTNGFNWGAAGVSNSVWRGVPLRHVLKRCGIFSGKEGALNVCFEGAEDLPGDGGTKYATSVTKQVAMDPARDIILAYMQNGHWLLPDHGYPVRMIIPGFIGGRMVKWLKRIIVTTKESDNFYHYKDNRVLPSHVDNELSNSEGWWYKPEYIINDLNTNSVITTPAHDDVLNIDPIDPSMLYTMRGYAYSGGGKKVTRVELTIDGGETWQVCDIDRPEKPNKYGRYWCWCFWSTQVKTKDLMSCKDVAVRAWDDSLNTQPEKLIWNLMGMMNNCWFRLKLNLCTLENGELGIMFQHPTQPANQPGGWMGKERELDTIEKSISHPFMNTNSKSFSMSEVNKHSSKDSAWIVVHGQVYDCTNFLNDHPGGVRSILGTAGTDCTDEFIDIHSDKAKTMLEDYRIGELVSTGSYNSSASTLASTSASTSSNDVHA